MLKVSTIGLEPAKNASQAHSSDTSESHLVPHECPLMGWMPLPPTSQYAMMMMLYVTYKGGGIQPINGINN